MTRIGCRRCQGLGQIPAGPFGGGRDNCPKCGGAGSVEETLSDGLQDELARVQRDIQAHRDKTRVVDDAQWCRHYARLLMSKADLLDRIREAA